MSAPIIETHSLTKRFGAFTAVRELSLCVQPGEIYAFLGLNGAGKTTTIRMLLGLVRPTEGAISICGERLSLGGKGPWNRVGSLVEAPTAYPELTVRENLEIYRRLRRVADPGCVADIMERLQIARYADRKAGKLSLGNLQRLGLAKAFFHKPKLLLLDEPMNGLDPAGIVEIREMLLDLCRNHGTTLFISSHILDEVARMATRIGIIHEGSLREEMDAQGLHAMRERSLRIRVGDKPLAHEKLRQQGYSCVEGEDGQLVVEGGESFERPEKVAELLVAAGASLMELYRREESLEEVFLRSIGKKGAAHA